MALATAAIKLWNRHADLLANPEPDLDNWRRKLLDEASKWPLHLPLPKPLLKDFLDLHWDILLSAKTWMSYHSRQVFWKFSNREDQFCSIIYMDLVVWYPNGVINYYETALNLIKSDELSDVEKYRLACLYCLKEEIEELWQKLIEEEPRNVFSGFLSEYPLIGYWNCYCIDKLYAVPFSGNISLDEYMVRHRLVDNWPAIEYFFDRLNVEEQVACAIYFIDHDDLKFEFQKLILMKMNESQLLHVYSERAVQIIQNYLRYGGVEVNVPNAISTWYEVRDLISPDQFVSLMQELCKAKTSDAILKEIWTSSSDEFKRHILSIPDYDFIGDVLRWGCRKNEFRMDFSTAVIRYYSKIKKRSSIKITLEHDKLLNKLTKKFLSEILTFDPDPVKDTIFRKTLGDKISFCRFFCKSLVTSLDFLKLERFLNFFFPPNDPESRQIIRCFLLRSLRYVGTYCLKFYSNGDVKGLNSLLAPLQSSFPEIILEFKKYLLFSEEGKDTCYSFFDSASDELTEIISDGFSDGELIVEYGRRIIFSNQGIDRLYDLICDTRIPNGIAKRNANLFLKSNEDIRKLKKCLLYSRQSLHSNYSHFDSTTNVLTEIVANGLIDSKKAIEFGRKIIFSNQGILKLHNLIRHKSFPNAVVKRNVNLFLKSDQDRRKLKSKLISSLTPRELRADPKAKRKYSRVLSILF